MKNKISAKAIALLMCICLVFAACIGCKDDGSFQEGENSIKCIVENASEFTDIVKVKVLAWDRITCENVELATFDCKDGAFTIKLSKIATPTHLEQLIFGDWYNEILLDFYKPTTVIEDQPTLSINDKNVKVMDVVFAGYDKDDNWLCNLSLLETNDESINKVVGTLTYVDSELTISGYTYPVRTDYSIKWKKGWNIWYRLVSITEIEDNNIIVTNQWTTTPISELKWYGSNALKL